jgi:hypothetical protein
VELIDAMEKLVELVKAELTTVSDDELCMATVFPGEQVPFDYGAESTCKGQLAVRLTTAFPSTSFPNPDLSANNCRTIMAYPLELTLVRKAPSLTTRNGRPILPTAAEHEAATRRQVQDMEAMYLAMRKLSKFVEDIVVGTYQPVGPDGGLVGGIWNLTIGTE